MDCLEASPELLFVASVPQSLLLVAEVTVLQQGNLALTTGVRIAALRQLSPFSVRTCDFQ